MKLHLTHILLTAGLSALLGAATLSAQEQIEVANIPLDDLWTDTDHIDDVGFPRGVWIHRLMDPN